MHQDLALALLAGLGGMLGWGLADFFAKKTIDRIGDVTTLFWGQLIGILPLLILFLFNPGIPQKIDGATGFAYLVLLGIWSGLSYIPTYVAFGKGKVSLLSPIFASYGVVVAILSAVFFGEIIPFGREIAFVVVFAGIWLINGDFSGIGSLIFRADKQKNAATASAEAAPEEVRGKVKGLREILLAVGLYSIWLIALDRFIKGEADWVPFLLVIRIFSAVSLFVYAKAKTVALRIPDKSLWKYLFLIGVFDVAAFAFVSYGFSRTPYTSVVAMLSGVFSLPTIVLARVFLKEKVTIVQTIGSLVVIAGIILLSLF
jgi:drug/metabolite transporter (DMT)-like permease